MAKTEKHEMVDDPKYLGKVGHIHANWSTDAKFDNGKTSGMLLFCGTSIAVYVDGHPDTHWHLDITEDLEALVESIGAGD